MKKLQETEIHLSPMQQAMLFDYLTRETPELDVLQVLGTLNESIITDVFARAWQQVVNCQPILRTYFCWYAQDNPFLMVEPELKIPIEFLDWSEVTPEQQQTDLDRLTNDDRMRGFDLSIAPLARLTLIRLSSNRHFLLLTVHHSIIDAISLRALIKDVFTLYDAHLSKKPIALNRTQMTEVQTKDKLFSDRSEEQSFWRDLIKGFSAPTPLPTIGRRALQSKSGRRRGQIDTFMPHVISDKLRQFASSKDVPLSTLVQAAWVILLTRYSGENDIIFGVVRRIQDFYKTKDTTLGLHINTVPMRIQVDGDVPLFEFVKQVRAHHLAIRPFKQTPIIDIRRWCGIQGRTELFRTVFVFNPDSFGQFFKKLGKKWQNREFHLAESLSSIPLGLYVDADPGLHLRLVYDRKQYDDFSAARVIDHLRSILAEMPNHPEEAIQNIPMLTGEERRLLDQWGGKCQDFVPACVNELIEKQVRKTPDVLALISTAGRLTYAELNKRAGALAKKLQRIGVGPDVLVGIYLTRSIEMVVSVLATLKAGGAYVPLDPEFPKARLEYMLDDAKVTVVLTESRFADNLPPDIPHVLKMDHGDDLDPESLDAFPEPKASPDNLAYVIYTSGSTGNPKGVMLEHRNVSNFFSAMDRIVNFTPGDVWLAVTSLSFDISVLELLWTLSRGFTVAIYRDEASDIGSEAQPAKKFQIGEYIKTYGITHIQCTPSMAMMMTMDESCRKEMHRLKQFLIGGEAFPYDLAAELNGLMKGEIINMYGPTETTIWSSSFTIPQNKLESLAIDSVIPIGRPILNNVFCILDRRLQPVPPGVAGELFIGGEGVARGYMNLPELTGERFIPDPFDPRAGARLYRTGDLVRYDHTGCMQFLGRMDFQVKIRGHRIEPAEIEQQIHQFPGIDQAAVVEQEFESGDKQLLACIIAAEGNKISVKDLKEHIRGRLPEYMMPTDFLFLNGFPLTPNKKLDRKALAAIRPKVSVSSKQKAQFRDGLESQVAHCWMQVLGARDIGKNDNFFDSGGDSFRAMKLHYALRKELNLDFPLTDIFSYPTIQSLAEYLGRQDSSAGFIENGLQRGKVRRKRISKGQDHRRGQGS